MIVLKLCDSIELRTALYLNYDVRKSQKIHNTLWGFCLIVFGAFYHGLR